MRLLYCLLLALNLFTSSAYGDAEGGGDKSKDTLDSIGIYGGRMLPYGIFGVRSIYPFWGMRWGRPFWGMNPELSTYFINAEDVNFYSASLSLTFPDTFVGFTYIPMFGLDYHYFRGHTNVGKLPFSNSLGFHVGVSPVIEIMSQVALRVDMKFNFGPGTALMVGGGLMVTY